MQVPFVDLKAQHQSIREEMRQAIENVIESSEFILGSQVSRFETDFASYLGVAHAIGTGNGLDALRLSLLCLGIGNGDEIIIPANTYIATALAISAVGAIPVLVDAEEHTLNLDPVLVEPAITQRTKAILLVHLYGQPADMDAFLPLVSQHKLMLIEDACQSHGAKYRGKCVGTFGEAGCFSFYPSKNLGALGDAGAIVTDNHELAEKLEQLRNYGQRKKYYNASKGLNSRLDNLQAALLNVKLKYLNQWNRKRMEHAALYNHLLAAIPQVKTPQTGPNRDHIFHVYVIRCQERDRLQAFLLNRGIQAQIHYPLPIHLQEAYADLGLRPGAYPVTEKLSNEVLSLPMYPELTKEQIQYVADSVSAFYAM